MSRNLVGHAHRGDPRVGAAIEEEDYVTDLLERGGSGPPHATSTRIAMARAPRGCRTPQRRWLSQGDGAHRLRGRSAAGSGGGGVGGRSSARSIANGRWRGDSGGLSATSGRLAMEEVIVGGLNHRVKGRSKGRWTFALGEQLRNRPPWRPPVHDRGVRNGKCPRQPRTHGVGDREFPSAISPDSSQLREDGTAATANSRRRRGAKWPATSPNGSGCRGDPRALLAIRRGRLATVSLTLSTFTEPDVADLGAGH